jgi:hypothetical protein
VTQFVNWLDHWQTLVSGVLAILAAFAGAMLLRKQIAQTEGHERDRLRRRSNAVRATLPLTLSGFGAFAKSAVIELKNAQLLLPANHIGVLPPGFNPPVPPSELVNDLKEMIESTDDEAVISAMSEIVSEVQTLYSRMSSLNDPIQMAYIVGSSLTMDQYIVQAARLYAIVEGLFDFARRKTECGPSSIAWDRVHSFLGQLYIDEAGHPGVFKVLHTRQKRLSVAWGGPCYGN